MTVKIASEMPFNPSCSLILLACVLYLDASTILAFIGCAVQCIHGKTYLRSDLSRTVQLCVHVHHYLIDNSIQFVHDSSYTTIQPDLNSKCC